MRARRAGIGLVVLSAILVALPSAAVDKKKAAYIGGTLQGIKEKDEGSIDTKGDSFVWRSAETAGKTVTIPYDKFVELEYGQKAGHKVAQAILLTPFVLFKKARHHFVTITFKDDDDKEQVVVWEFGKEIIRSEIKIIQVRSGKELKFTDEDAKKNFGR